MTNLTKQSSGGEESQPVQFKQRRQNKNWPQLQEQSSVLLEDSIIEESSNSPKIKTKGILPHRKGGAPQRGGVMNIRQTQSVLDVHHQPLTQNNSLAGIQLQASRQQQSLASLEPRKNQNVSQMQFGSGAANKRSQSNMMGDYQSMSTLPKIRQENEYTLVDLQRPKRTGSKVELTKKDMANFLSNGTITKEFIKTNKQELQKFIRSNTQLGQGGLENTKDARMTLLRNASSLRDSTEMRGNKSNAMMHASAGEFNSNASLMSEAALRSAHATEGQFYFPDDQKPEKKFQGETSIINSKVLETWINETLQEAEHLAIPGVITKPENKKAIVRYGIDRDKLTNEGQLSNDTIDRIYRCLFVYSIGFFELLKSSKLSYQLMINIWKAFSVLLEYSCQSDYKLMIAEITALHEIDKQKIRDDFKEKIETQYNEMRTLKVNMVTMQVFQDQLEKDKANERELRLKLEEEYMQNSKNHEEEIILRLKFEAKLNKLHTDYRELQINHERLQDEHLQLDKKLDKSEAQIRVQRTELVDLRNVRIENESIIDKLSESDKTMILDLRKKSQMIQQARLKQQEAKDQGDINLYEVTDKQKVIADMRSQIIDLKIHMANRDSEIATLKIQLKDETDFKLDSVEKLEQMSKQFTVMKESQDSIDEKNAFYKVQYDEKVAQLKETLKSNDRLKELNQELSDENGKLTNKAEDLTKFYDKTKTQLEDSLRKMTALNEDRHKLSNNLGTGHEIIEVLEDEIRDKIEIIETQSGVIKSLESTLKDMTALKCEWEHKHIELSRVYKDAIAQWQEEKIGLKNDIEKLNDGIGRFKTLFNKKTNELEELQREFKLTMQDLAKMNTQNSETNSTLLAIQRELAKTQKLLQEQTNIATDCMARTITAERHQRKLEETVRITQTQRKKELFKYRKDVEALQLETEKVFNSSTMEVEDFHGKVRVFKELNQALQDQMIDYEQVKEEIITLKQAIEEGKERLIEIKQGNWDRESVYKQEIVQLTTDADKQKVEHIDINKNLEDVINDLRQQAKERANNASEEQKTLRLEITEWKGKAMRAERGGKAPDKKSKSSKRGSVETLDGVMKDKQTQTKPPQKKRPANAASLGVTGQSSINQQSEQSLSRSPDPYKVDGSINQDTGSAAGVSIDLANQQASTTRQELKSKIKKGTPSRQTQNQAANSVNATAQPEPMTQGQYNQEMAVTGNVQEPKKARFNQNPESPYQNTLEVRAGVQSQQNDRNQIAGNEISQVGQEAYRNQLQLTVSGLSDHSQEQVATLEQQKQIAIQSEDYDLAKKLNQEIIKIKAIESPKVQAQEQVAKLEQQKQIAIQNEDYDLAKQLKVAITKIKANEIPEVQAQPQPVLIVEDNTQQQHEPTLNLENVKKEQPQVSSGGDEESKEDTIQTPEPVDQSPEKLKKREEAVAQAAVVEKERLVQQEQLMLQDEFTLWYVKKCDEWITKAILEQSKGTPIQHSVDILQNIRRTEVHPKFKRLKLTKDFTEKAHQDALEAFNIEKENLDRQLQIGIDELQLEQANNSKGFMYGDKNIDRPTEEQAARREEQSKLRLGSAQAQIDQMKLKLDHFMQIKEQFPLDHPSKMKELLAPGRQTQITKAKDLHAAQANKAWRLNEKRNTIMGAESHHELIKMDYVPTAQAKATDNLQKALEEVKTQHRPKLTHSESLLLEAEEEAKSKLELQQKQDLEKQKRMSRVTIVREPSALQDLQAQVINSNQLSRITSEEDLESKKNTRRSVKDYEEEQQTGAWSKAAALKSPRIRTSSKDSKESRESSIGARPDAPQYDPTQQNQSQGKRGRHAIHLDTNGEFHKVEVNGWGNEPQTHTGVLTSEIGQEDQEEGIFQQRLETINASEELNSRESSRERQVTDPDRMDNRKLVQDIEQKMQDQHADQITSLAQGGTAAVHNQLKRQRAQEQRTKSEQQELQRKRVEFRQSALNASNQASATHLPKTRQNPLDTRKVSGPPTIRTLIRAVDSRKDQETDEEE